MQDCGGSMVNQVGERFCRFGNVKTASRFNWILTCGSEQCSSTRNCLFGLVISFWCCMTALMSEKSFLFDRLVLFGSATFSSSLLGWMRGVKLTGLKKSRYPLVRPLLAASYSNGKAFSQVNKTVLYERGTFKVGSMLVLDDYLSFHRLQRGWKKGYQLGCPQWMEAAIFSATKRTLKAIA